MKWLNAQASQGVRTIQIQLAKQIAGIAVGNVENGRWKKLRLSPIQVNPLLDKTLTQYIIYTHPASGSTSLDLIIPQWPNPGASLILFMIILGHFMTTAIFVDAGFFLKRFHSTYPKKNQSDPAIVAKVLHEMALDHLTQKGAVDRQELYRIFVYDCPPLNNRFSN